MGKQPNMSDVAKLAGVSESTVSRVLSGSETSVRISESTRKRVTRAAAELGYTPNPVAQALRGGASKLIGIIVREIADPYFATLVELLSRYAAQRDYKLLLGHAGSSSLEAVQLSDILDHRFCDGVLVLGDLMDDRIAMERIYQVMPQVVAVSRGQPIGPIRTVNVDNSKGAFLALDYLVALGHRRIAFLDGGWLGDICERRRAYVSYMEDHGLPLDEQYIRRAPNSMKGGYEATRELLALPSPPSAVFASVDVMAIGALRAAAEAGLKVPGDLSVVGFDDLEIASYSVPPLTTVRQPLAEMSRIAVDTLVDLIEDRDADQDRLLVTAEPKLVIRASCGPPRDSLEGSLA